MKNEAIAIRREASGRAPMRGLLLLVVLFSAATAALAQATVLTQDDSARLRRQLNGTIEEKRTALFEIRNLRSPEASILAMTALLDSNEIVRATAAASVVFMHRHEAANALLPLLDDKAEFVRREAASALGEVGYSSAIAPLIQLMRRDKILEVRTAAAIALGKTGDSTTVESLVAILRSNPSEDLEFLRRSAARSIGQIAQREVMGDAQTVTPQNFLPEKFKDIGPKGVGSPAGFGSAIDVLLRVLQSSAESDDTRREAAFALGAIGDRKAVATLRSFTASPDPYLAEIAREAILTIERRNKTEVSGNK